MIFLNKRFKFMVSIIASLVFNKACPGGRLYPPAPVGLRYGRCQATVLWMPAGALLCRAPLPEAGFQGRQGRKKLDTQIGIQYQYSLHPLNLHKSVIQPS